MDFDWGIEADRHALRRRDAEWAGAQSLDHLSDLHLLEVQGSQGKRQLWAIGGEVML